MKRSRAILLFGLMTVLIGGYVGWCSRSFWLKVPLPDLSCIPEKERVSFLQELEGGELRNPPEFTFQLFSYFLTHPYDSSRETIGVSYTESERGASATATRSSKYLRLVQFTLPFTYTIPVEFFEKDDSGWRRLPKIEEITY